MAEAKPTPAKYIFLDVISFTHNRSVESQTDIVESLNKIVKSAITENNLQPENIIYLPTGDGICISLLNVESPFDVHLLIALSIINGIHAHNENTQNEMRKFEVRIGLNANTDNLVIDINGGRNMAGAGINMAARVMGMADGNQILVGESVYETLHYREKYMRSFNSFQATVKHGLKISVHQFISDEHPGLNVDIPRSFRLDQKTELKLTKLAAYYFAHAISNRGFFLKKKGHYEANVGNVLLWLLAKDSEYQSKTTEIDIPLFRTYGAPISSFRDQYSYYSSMDRDLVEEMASLIRSQLLRQYGTYLEGELDYRFISSEGRAKLKQEYPSIWEQFDLENYV